MALKQADRRRNRSDQAGLAAGDERFVEFVMQHAGALRGYCLRLASSRWEADDLLQSSLEKALAAYRRNPGRPLARAFLYRIAANAWVDSCRHKREDAAGQADELYAARAAGDAALPPDGDDVRAALETLVACLPAAQRAAVLLVDVWKFSAAEAAELLRTTEGAVKASLHRARQRLRLVQAGIGIADGAQADADEVDAYWHAFRQTDVHRIVRIAGVGTSGPTMLLAS
ncbi:MAG: RNA polymerase sigma factor [Paenibacillaceae bacterium]|nr:RNA polymerase sigma factor [Paenibacillaceae bacterium]